MKKFLLFVAALLVSAMSFADINLAAGTEASVDKGDGKGYKDNKPVFLSSYSDAEVKFIVDDVEFAQIGCQYNSKNTPSALSPATKQFIQLRKVDSGTDPKPCGAIYNKAAFGLIKIAIVQYSTGATNTFRVLAGNAADALTEVTQPAGVDEQFEYTQSDDAATVAKADVKTFLYELSGNKYFRIENTGKVPVYFGAVTIVGSKVTAIDNAIVAPKAVKLIENGQLVIIRDGVRYNTVGQVIE